MHLYMYIQDENIRNVIIEKFYTEPEQIQWTKNCIICFDPDVVGHTGHVHRNTTRIIAGFCSKHHHHDYKPHTMIDENYCTGCCGEYKIEMGYEKHS